MKLRARSLQMSAMYEKVPSSYRIHQQPCKKTYKLIALRSLVTLSYLEYLTHRHLVHNSYPDMSSVSAPQLIVNKLGSVTQSVFEKFLHEFISPLAGFCHCQQAHQSLSVPL